MLDLVKTENKKKMINFVVVGNDLASQMWDQEIEIIIFTPISNLIREASILNLNILI